MCHDQYDSTNVLGHQQPTPGYDGCRQSQQIKRFSDRTNLSQQRMKDTTSSKTIPCHTLHYKSARVRLFHGCTFLRLFDAKCFASSFISSGTNARVSPTSLRLSLALVQIQTQPSQQVTYMFWFHRHRIKTSQGHRTPFQNITKSGYTIGSPFSSHCPPTDLGGIQSVTCQKKPTETIVV
jgi:hypothetical protein